MALKVGNRLIPTTQFLFLLDADDWDEAVAMALAEIHGITLKPIHWKIIYLLRDYCSKSDRPLSMRVLSQAVKDNLNADYARSIYLMQLFGPSPATMAARLSGLPKPKNCL